MVWWGGFFHCTCLCECLQTYHAEWFGGEDFSTVHARVSAYKRTVPTGPVMRIAPLPIAGCGRACLRTSDQAPPAAAGTCLIQTMQVYSFRPCVLIHTMQVYSLRPCVLIQTMHAHPDHARVLIQTLHAHPDHASVPNPTMRAHPDQCAHSDSIRQRLYAACLWYIPFLDWVGD